ncbi:MAG: Mth938-like domain-containing protein [Pseudomonadota bacterium]
MRLNEVHYPDTPPVGGYGPGFFRIDGEVINGGLLVLPGVRRSWSGYDDLTDILAAAPKIDVLFVGTGNEIAHIPSDVRKAFDQADIGAEVMASPTACRTFNVLLGEGRRIGLAALPVI